VWHPHPHIKPGIDSCGNRTLNKAERVVQQHFVITDMNADGRHPGKLTLEWRSQWVSSIGTSEIGTREFGHLRAREKRIGVRARVIGHAGKSQVGNRRQHGDPDKGRAGGDGFADNARREYQREIASGGISCKGDPANSAPGEPPITCQRIVYGGREGMFRGKPIVRDKRPRSGSRRNMPDKMAVGLGRSKVEPATVQMYDCLIRPPFRRIDPNSRYSAEGACFECHVVSRRDALHESIELCASLGSAWHHALGGADMARRAVVNAASSGSSGCITTKSGDVRSAADPI